MSSKRDSKIRILNSSTKTFLYTRYSRSFIHCMYIFRCTPRRILISPINIYAIFTTNAEWSMWEKCSIVQTFSHPNRRIFLLARITDPRYTLSITIEVNKRANFRCNRALYANVSRYAPMTLVLQNVTLSKCHASTGNAAYIGHGEHTYHFIGTFEDTCAVQL